MEYYQVIGAGTLAEQCQRTVTQSLGEARFSTLSK